MNLKEIENFLINICGYKSIEDAIKNTPKLNFYPLIGEIDFKKEEKK